MKLSKKTLLLIGSGILGIFLLLIVLKIAGLGETFRIIFKIRLIDFLTIVFLTFLQFFLSVVLIKIILCSFGYNIPLFDLFPQRAAMFAISYLTPFASIGGEPFIAFLFKKKYKIPYKITFSSFLIEFVFRLTITTFLIGLGILILATGFSFPAQILISFIIIFFLIVGFLSFFYLYFFKKSILKTWFGHLKLEQIGFIKNNLEHLKYIEEKIGDFLKNKFSILILSLFFSFLIIFTIFWRYKLIFLAFGLQPSFIDLLLIFTVENLATFTPIPSALGITESAQAILFSLLNFGIPVGVAFVLVGRAATLLLVFYGLLILPYLGIKEFNNLFSKNSNKEELY